jgi:hypothetical protein
MEVERKAAEDDDQMELSLQNHFQSKFDKMVERHDNLVNKEKEQKQELQEVE